MLLLIVFAPILTALLVLFGAPARLTSLIGAGATASLSLLALFLYQPAIGGFQFDHE